MTSPRIFVSYRRSRAVAVNEAAAALHAAGCEVFVDRDDIDPLADFPARLRAAIDDSHAVLVWWSADYADSDFCMQELRRGWQQARKLSSDVGRRVWVLNPEATAAHRRPPARLAPRA